MNIERPETRRMIRDGVAEEMVTLIQSLLTRVDKVESELRNHQFDCEGTANGLQLFRERKQQLETVEETIDLIIQQHTRGDLDVLIGFAGELRHELVSLYKDLEQALSPNEKPTA